MRHLAITGIVTASWISRILSGSAMRATPPSARMSAGPLLTRIVPVSAIAAILALDTSPPAAGALSNGGTGGRGPDEGASAGRRLLRRFVARGVHARRHEGDPPAP